VGGREDAVAAHIANSKVVGSAAGAGVGLGPGELGLVGHITHRQTQGERLILLAEVDAAAASMKARCDRLASLTAQAAARAET
jgi:hypothetical protein